MAIMTTRGAKTGQPRSAPIWIYPDGDDWVVVASRGGDRRLPGWYHNLHANPRATLQIGRERTDVQAREATGEDHERLWELVTNAYPGYAYYRERSGRHIPIMVLTREESRPDAHLLMHDLHQVANEAPLPRRLMHAAPSGVT